MIKFVAYQSDRLVGSDFTTDNSFTTYSDWTISPTVLSAYSDCGSLGRVFGGYGKFGQKMEVSKIYSWINTAHYGLLVYIKFLKIDSWDSIDWVDVYVGSVKQERITSTSGDGPNNQCGGVTSYWGKPYNEKMFSLSYNIDSHTSYYVEIKFISNLDDVLSDESWGIRELYILLKMCDTSCLSCSGPSNTQCLTCQINAALQPSGRCLCRNYYFLKDRTTMPCMADPCSFCSRCHISCKTCEGGENKDCSSCENEDSFSTLGKTCTYPPSKKINNTLI